MSKPSHPYKQYEKTAVWRALDRGLKDLVKNGDVAEHTARPYIVGYLAKLLADAGVHAAAKPSMMKVVELHDNEQLIVRTGKVAG